MCGRSVLVLNSYDKCSTSFRFLMNWSWFIDVFMLKYTLERVLLGIVWRDINTYIFSRFLSSKSFGSVSYASERLIWGTFRSYTTSFISAKTNAAWAKSFGLVTWPRFLRMYEKFRAGRPRQFPVFMSRVRACRIFALHWGAAMFEPVVLQFDLSFTHDIIAKGLLNILDGLSLSNTKLLAKHHVITMPDAFGYIVWKRKSDEYAQHVYTLGVTAIKDINL